MPPARRSRRRAYLFRTSALGQPPSAPGSVERLITLTVNGQERRVDVMKQETLVQPLRYQSSQPPPPFKHGEIVVWHKLGSWSGRGDAQTESFQSDSGALRVRWEARGTDRHDAEQFRLTLQSAISGRPLAVAADQRGASSGEALVPETPRAMYAFIESADVNWSFTVEEGIVGTLPESARRK